jgi:uncharacterized protein
VRTQEKPHSRRQFIAEQAKSAGAAGSPAKGESNEAMMTPPLSVADPCINICRMDLSGKYCHCQGCGRTLVEIGLWGQMTDAKRADVMATLPLRLPRRSAQSLPPAPSCRLGGCAADSSGIHQR